MGLERRSLAAAGRNPGMRAKDARQSRETEPTPPPLYLYLWFLALSC